MNEFTEIQVRWLKCFVIAVWLFLLTHPWWTPKMLEITRKFWKINYQHKVLTDGEFEVIVGLMFCALAVLVATLVATLLTAVMI